MKNKTHLGVVRRHIHIKLLKVNFLICLDIINTNKEGKHFQLHNTFNDIMPHLKCEITVVVFV